MAAEDIGFFTADPYIPSVYFHVGDTPKDDFELAKKNTKDTITEERGNISWLIDKNDFE